MKKVIVFGGAGFLGSHVAEALSEGGYAVSIFDLRESPYLRRDQVMCVGDILDKKAVMEACRGAHYIYNFAGLADIDAARNQPELTVQLNIVGNLNVLEAARTVGAEKFVFASTVYVYGDSGSFYRVSKQTSEQLVEIYWEKYRLPFTILRYGSLYGRRADERNTIFRFIRSAISQKKILYPGHGNELRDYIHVLDAARASVSILSNEFTNQHLVITGNQSLRVRDVMEMIAEILAFPIQIEFENHDIDSHYNLTPYVYKPKIGRKLVVNPYVDMGQGILDCIHSEVECHDKSSIEAVFENDVSTLSQ